MGTSVADAELRVPPLKSDCTPMVAKEATSEDQASRHVKMCDMSQQSNARIDTVGYYKIIKTLGKGNFATVKLARHTVAEKEVALKIIDKKRLKKDCLKKIHREVKIMKSLAHPSITKLYQVMETDKLLLLVTEYAAGGEIFDHLVAHGRLPEHQARAKFHQVVDAIRYCHDNHIVHRDLKAENILLDKDFNVKLADFGFSNYYFKGQTLKTWCGSPPYAAPELFEGKEYIGPAVDMWSLGVLLYVLVCGAMPFDGSSITRLRQKILIAEFNVPSFVSSDCEKLIRNLLVRVPEDRLTVRQVQADKWMQMGGVPSPTHPLAEETVGAEGALGKSRKDEAVVDTIARKFGLDKNNICQLLDQKKYDNLYAVYHLLKEQKDSGIPLSWFKVVGARPSSAQDAALSSTRYRKRDIVASRGTGHEQQTRRVHIRRHTFDPNRSFSSPRTAAISSRHIISRRGSKPEAAGLKDIPETSDTCSEGEPSGAPRATAAQGGLESVPAARESQPAPVLDGRTPGASGSPKGDMMETRAGTGMAMDVDLEHPVWDLAPPACAVASRGAHDRGESVYTPKDTHGVHAGGGEPPVAPWGPNVNEVVPDTSHLDAHTTIDHEGAGDHHHHHHQPHTGNGENGTISHRRRHTVEGSGITLQGNKLRAPAIADDIGEETDPTISGKPRPMRLALAVNMTSSLPPEQVLEEINHKLAQCPDLEFYQSVYIFTVRRGEVVLELEVCRVQGLTTCGVRLKRITGDSWAYKALCTELLTVCKLT